MPSARDIAQARTAFAEELRATAPVLRHERVAAAFAAVPRERFVGRDEAAAERLGRALARLKVKPVPVAAMHRGAPPERARHVWYRSPGIWLSRRPLAS